MQKRHFLALFALHGAVLLYLAYTTPITPHEAKIFYDNPHTVVGYLMHWGYGVWPGVFGLRLAFVALAFCAVWGYYYLIKRDPKEHRSDVYLSVTLFMFLPGIVIAGSMANIGIIVLNLVILFLHTYLSKRTVAAITVMLLLFLIHEASVIFFLALLFYAFAVRHQRLMIASVTFLVAHLLLERGIDIGGRPSGHFLDIFGLYATVFSPLLFLYFVYTMYRILLRGERTVAWYVSFTALVVSLVLSLRQKVYITDFAPYVMIATHLMVETFQKSVRVRLPQFRKPYYVAFGITMAMLALTIGIALTAPMTYRLSKHPHKHFAARIYEPYESAMRLKRDGVTCCDVTGRKALQLRFYGITACSR